MSSGSTLVGLAACVLLVLALTADYGEAGSGGKSGGGSGGNSGGNEGNGVGARLRYRRLRVRVALMEKTLTDANCTIPAWEEQPSQDDSVREKIELFQDYMEDLEEALENCQDTVTPVPTAAEDAD